MNCHNLIHMERYIVKGKDIYSGSSPEGYWWKEFSFLSFSNDRMFYFHVICCSVQRALSPKMPQGLFIKSTVPSTNLAPLVNI